MRKRGVLLRDRSSDPGCDGYVRITIGIEEHVTRGLAALQESLKENGLLESASGKRGGRQESQRKRTGVGVMSEIDGQRRKVVVLCAAVACMATAAAALRGHPVLVGGLITLQIITLVYAVVE